VGAPAEWVPDARRLAVSALGFPLMLLPAAVYHIFALLFGVSEWNAAVASIHMVSGVDWVVSYGDLVVIGALILLFVEIFKATRTSSRSIVDHLLSMAVFVVMLIEFILWAPFATSTYAILIVISLIDVVGGFTITIRTAQRDLALEKAADL
jgi:hypothetical protein